MRQIRNQASTQCFFHNLASQASFWVRDSHNNPLSHLGKTSPKGLLLCVKALTSPNNTNTFHFMKTEQLFLLQFTPNTATESRIIHLGAGFWTSLPHAGSGIRRCQRTWGQLCRRKRCFTSKSREQVVGKRWSCRDATCENRFFLSTQKREAHFSEFSLYLQY